MCRSQTPSAFLELTRGRSVYDEKVTGANIARFSSASGVSLPDTVRGAPFLDEVIPAWMQILFENSMERMLRSDHELKREELVEPHWDARLKSCRRTFLRFVKALIAKDMIVPLCGGQAKERVGVFFVKKAGKISIRMILDARRVNQRFRPPPGVELCSSEGLSRVELELPQHISPESPEGRAILDEARVHLGNGDAKDAFHRFRLRPSLAACFCLGTVRAGEVGLAGRTLGGKTWEAMEEVDLCWGSLPMGFSWSLLFC